MSYTDHKPWMSCLGSFLAEAKIAAYGPGHTVVSEVCRAFCLMVYASVLIIRASHALAFLLARITAPKYEIIINSKS